MHTSKHTKLDLPFLFVWLMMIATGVVIWVIVLPPIIHNITKVAKIVAVAGLVGFALRWLYRRKEEENFYGYDPPPQS